MFDENFNLKLIDFGFSAPLKEGEDGSGMMTSICGTPGFMAPEILSRKKYNGQEVDMFALGVILFTMIAQRPPFNSAEKSDKVYNLIITGRTELFWKLHTKN